MLKFSVADLWPDSLQELGILQNEPLLRFARALEAWGYRHATYVNAVTERMKSILLTRKQVPPSKLLFLPNGVDTDLFRLMLPDPQLADALRLRGKSVILYAGNHGYIAGLEHALRAARILESSPNIHFSLRKWRIGEAALGRTGAYSKIRDGTECQLRVLAPGRN